MRQKYDPDFVAQVSSGGGGAPMHTTHFDDCGCLSTRLAAENAALKTRECELTAEHVGGHDKPAICVHCYAGIIEDWEADRKRLAKATALVRRVRSGNAADLNGWNADADAFLREAEERS